jgi:hypothetical protein
MTFQECYDEIETMFIGHAEPITIKNMAEAIWNSAIEECQNRILDREKLDAYPERHDCADALEEFKI